MPYFAEKHEKSSTWPRLSTFRTNDHVSVFWRTFWQELAKNASFREKTRNIIDLARTWNFSNKSPSFEVLTNFWAKSCKTCLMSWKITRNHRFDQDWTFRIKLPRFGVLMNFSAESCNKCLISWQNTKNHRFRKNSQLFEQTTTFRRFDELFSKKLQKVPHFVKKQEKSWIWPKLTTFRTNHHVSIFWRTFQQKVGKTPSFREKTRKLVNLP